MRQEPGLWALQGIRQVGAHQDGEKRLVPSSQGLVVNAFSCPVCGLVRIYEWKPLGGSNG
jgi:hypothetical protein